MFQRLIAFTLLMAACSCKEITGEVPVKAELLKEELRSIDWKQVDEYPSIAECDRQESKEQRRLCFFQVLTAAIQDKLNADTLPLRHPQLDTIKVKVTIYPDARMQFESIVPSDTLSPKSIRVDSILQARITDFPKVTPALKRGIPVRTQFILPVVVSVN